MEAERPKPEALLQRLKEEERQEKGGKLKIYLGAAPGVGKTYTMLQDAITQRIQGKDIVVGIAESHGREEIENFLKNLEKVPRQKIEYHGQQLSEFDLDAALRRKPKIILVDEMAHTNAPGALHNKRWQDIKELLDRGIDVYTTLNVQHIESLNNDVAAIINAPIKETVPDAMLALADTIELVDLPPEDLLKRLQEGKVYCFEQAELAKKHFFRKGNLIALRELALRTTATFVGTQTLLYRQGENIQQIWRTKEKILVCVGTGAESLNVIRAACRTANSLKVQWMAAFVDTPKLQASEIMRNRAIQNLRVAEQLGAEIHVLNGFDIVKEILNFAHEQNITQIMIWKHIRPRWKNFLRRNLTDELVRNSGEIDVYIMTGVADKSKPPKPVKAKKKAPWRTYMISIIIVALATLVNILLAPYLVAANLIMVYLLGVIAVALYGRTGPANLASLLSVLAYDFFFIPPFYSFVVADVQYFFTLLVMLGVTQVISYLTILTRRQAEAARFTEHQTSALYKLSRRLANTRGIENLLKTGTHYLQEIFDSVVVALIPKNNQLEMRPRNKKNPVLDEKEMSVAKWSYELGQMAGLGTDTLPFSNAIYIPLLATQGPVGVIRVQPRTKQLFTPEQMRLLEACSNQIALALEVDRLQEQTRQTEFEAESNRARKAIFQSVSQDLRAPLVSIMTSVHAQVEMKNIDPEINAKLAKKIYSESEELNRMINNLSRIANLESESLNLSRETYPIKETILMAINALHKKLGKREINIIIASDFINLQFDPSLIQEVILNLIDNALKFTPRETPIDISVTQEGDSVLISIEDRGPGIVPDEIEKLFEQFYRGRMIKTKHGFGLGLAICHYIIKAHSGKIWAENREGGGASFRFTLPL